MKFVAERKAMVDALAFVARYAARDNSVPVLADVLLATQGNNVVVMATDLGQLARDTFVADVADEGSACLPAAALFKAIKSATGAEVAIDAGDKRAAVVSGRQRFEFPAIPSGDFPAMPMLNHEGERFTLDAETLERVTKRVAAAVEPPKGRYILTGVNWHGNGSEVVFMATDGKRVSRLTVDCSATINVVVPTFAIPAWEGQVSVTYTERFIRLQSGNQVVASQLLEGHYPDIDRLIPQSGLPRLFDRAEFLGAIRRVSPAANPSILIVGRDGSATLRAEDGDHVATDVVAFEGEDFQVSFAVLGDVLETFESEMIELRITDHAVPVTLHDPKDVRQIGLAYPYRDPRLVQYMPMDAA